MKIDRYKYQSDTSDSFNPAPTGVEAILNPISSLPVETHPGYSVRKAMESFAKSASRLQPVLEPSFLRKMLGGMNSDYARSVSATCNENARLVRGVLQAASAVAMQMEMTGSQSERDRGRVLAGTCRRIIERLDEWRATATDFESNNHGSKKRLIDLTKRLMHLVKEIDHPAAGLQ